MLERGDVVMVFNFHPVNSYQDYRVGCLLPGPYKVPPPTSAPLLPPALAMCCFNCQPSFMGLRLRPAAAAF